MINGDEDGDGYECLLYSQPRPEWFQVWAADKVKGETIPQSCHSREERVHVSVNSWVWNWKPVT